MHVKAKKMALCGLMLALSVICMVLGSVIEMNTMFLLAAASFFVGIVIRIFGKGTGAAFFIAAILLGLILAPNKLYVITYGAMSLYILSREYAWDRLAKSESKAEYKGKLLWIIKYIVFNLFYIPAVIGFQHLLFEDKTGTGIVIAVIVAGQAGLFLYDGAYEYVQRNLTKWIGRAGW